MTINYMDLREAVMNKWDAEGVSYYQVKFFDAIPPRVENWLRDWAQIILDNPRLCLIELGYSDNDWSNYIAIEKAKKT